VTDEERYQLIGGPLLAPNLRRGDVVICFVRDCDCIVTGWTDGRVAWPKGRARGKGATGPIVTEDLARALAVESGIALCYWLGITSQTITKWKRAIGLGPHTPGQRDCDDSTLSIG